MAKQDVWIPSDSDAPRVKQSVTEKSNETVWVPDDTQAPRVPMNATGQAPRVPVRPEPEQAPRVPMTATEQAWDVVAGTGELATTLATGAVAPVAGALGVLAAQGRNLSRRVANAFGADRPLEDTQVYRETRDKYTYQPRSESGQASVRALGAMVEPIIEPVVGAVAKVPGMGRDNAEFLVDAAMMGTGAKAAKSPRAAEVVKTTGRVAKDVATEMSGKVAGATMRTAERAVDFAKENPITTSAAGAAAGYLASGPIGAAAGYAVKSLLDKSRAADVAITSGIDEIAKTTSARNNRVRGEGAFSIPTGEFTTLEDMSAVKQAKLARDMGSAGVKDFVRIYNNAVVANAIDRLKSETGKTTVEILKRDKNDELLNSLRKMKAEEEFPDLSGADLVDAWTERYLDRGLLNVSESSPASYQIGQRGIIYVTDKEFNRLKNEEAGVSDSQAGTKPSVRKPTDSSLTTPQPVSAGQTMVNQLQGSQNSTLSQPVPVPEVVEATPAVSKKQVEQVQFNLQPDDPIYTAAKEMGPKGIVNSPESYVGTTEVKSKAKTWSDTTQSNNVVILSGPPGTGKTSLFEAYAGSAKKVEIIPGVLSQSKLSSVIRDVVEQADKEPVFVLIDEADKFNTSEVKKLNGLLDQATKRGQTNIKVAFTTNDMPKVENLWGELEDLGIEDIKLDNPSKQQLVSYAKGVAEAQGIEISNDQLRQFVDDSVSYRDISTKMGAKYGAQKVDEGAFSFDVGLEVSDSAKNELKKVGVDDGVIDNWQTQTPRTPVYLIVDNNSPIIDGIQIPKDNMITMRDGVEVNGRAVGGIEQLYDYISETRHIDTLLIEIKSAKDLVKLSNFNRPVERAGRQIDPPRIVVSVPSKFSFDNDVTKAILSRGIDARINKN